MNTRYEEHVRDRAAAGVLPLPLSVEQVEELTGLLCSPAGENGLELVGLLVERVPAGVDPAARVKADFLAAVVKGERACPLISPEYALELLGTMVGGYNVNCLVEFLADGRYGALAAEALKNIILVFDSFEKVRELMDGGNVYAAEVIRSWAEAEWFTNRPALAERIEKIVYKVDGVVNNDDLSPPKYAATRADIPLHALTMGEDKFPDGIEVMRKNRELGPGTAFTGETVGVGSSRKSAVNSLIWAIGDDIPFVPNKRRGGVVLAGSIAPIFFNTFEDSGGLPIVCDVTGIEHGSRVEIDTVECVIRDEAGKVLSEFEITPKTLPDEYRAGGRVPLIIGRKLTQKARQALGMAEEEIFIRPDEVEVGAEQKYTLAQKIIGKACGKDGVIPGETCEPSVATVGSQDATGLMTRDELTELACLKFKAPLTLQSFCHTAAYPKEKDLLMHKTLPEYFECRGGVALRPGDGIIHSWLNRMLVPDQVGTGGDSHVHFPLGLSFPAGSGLVAFAAALGCMPLDMPESMLVSLNGEMREGITLRDVVGYIALMGDKKSAGGRSVFNGKILEMEGLTESLTVEQAFELTASAAERSAAGCTVALSDKMVREYLCSNAALLEGMIAEGYEQKEAIRGRLGAIREWLDGSELLRRDEGAEFSCELEVDLSGLTEPVIAAPNNPNNVGYLSDHAGRVIDEVFIGSCMTNIGHFRAAAKILAGKKSSVKTLWIVPPTRMDMEQLMNEGVIQELKDAGARVEIPGCSLCMGNQARTQADAVVFSTSTKNTNNRMGTGAQIYLGSAELAAVVALLGRIPSVEEYFEIYKKDISGNVDSIYKYLNFAE